ncbi:MAG: hypothetical protein A2Y97_01245 [Nitrospirae bacterium RBG_13_39_12]|nr:MAG: hypothetical protein A2Y97_01245 [Nitrospirae bacterium RBG_13_39_12]
MSTETIISVIVRPPDEPSIQVQLVKQVLPGEPENYFIVGQKLKQCECGEETATEQWSVPILTPVARKIMAPLESIRIPPVSKSQFKQVDGCSYELYLGGALSHSHYQWSVSAS